MKTVLKTKAILSVHCENCGNRFSYSHVITMPSGITYDAGKKLEEKIGRKEFGTRRCPKCGYLQSWMWDQVLDDKRQGFLGFVVVLPLWWWLSKIKRMSWWAGLILALIIGAVLVGLVGIIINGRVRRLHMSKLAAKGFVFTPHSLRILEKTTIRPDNAPGGRFGLELTYLKPLLNREFADEQSLIAAIGTLENSQEVRMFRNQIIRSALKTHDPEVVLQKPPASIGEIPLS